KLAPKNGSVYRLLGEVLLRRGDAARADKVLERAMLLGGQEDTALWRDRARGYLEMQKEAGERAVASEVARVLQEASFPLRSMFDSETTTVRKMQTLAADPPQLAPPTPDRGVPAMGGSPLTLPPPAPPPPPPPPPPRRFRPPPRARPCPHPSRRRPCRPLRSARVARREAARSAACPRRRSRRERRAPPRHRLHCKVPGARPCHRRRH